MEETLGKRIAQHRKRLALTQEGLAEQLGVTAQAVSKWENDQACPDITMLPKLGAIFDITVDELLGVSKKEEAAVVVTEPDPADHEAKQNVPGKTGETRFALWLVLVGGILLALELLPVPFYRISVWKAMCLTGLIGYGLLGLYPRFSMFRLGCALFGGYYLWAGLTEPHIMLNEELLIPILLVFFGLGLLIDRPRRKNWMDLNMESQNRFEYRGGRFLCSTGFGEDHRLINLPVLEGGEAIVCFGELSLDLSGCGHIQEGSRIALKCAFGSLTVYVPRKRRVQSVNRSFFGTVQERGCPDADADGLLWLENHSAFGEIVIKYI